MNEEIIYERNLTGSYMKLPAGETEQFDEKMLLRKKIPGLLPVEKCYMDGNGQYWYDISGKQSLDTYCQIRNVGIGFVERMIESICNEIEILDRNLINADCLLLDAGQIFVTNQNQELVFAAYPRKSEPVSAKFQQLMEYMITKIDHKDQKAVQMAYELYEKTLDEGYNIMDVRDSVIESRRKTAAEKSEMEQEKTVYGAAVQPAAAKNLAAEKADGLGRVQNELNQSRLQENFMQLLNIGEDWRKKLKQILPEKMMEAAEVVYPDEDSVILQEKPASNPTVCLSDYRAHPDGLLLYEGHENFQDVRLCPSVSTIGNGEGVDVSIEKETISRYHAQISCENQEFYLEDLNSMNGTYVNESLLSYKERRLLKSNDIIRFADVKYRFL